MEKIEFKSLNREARNQLRQRFVVLLKQGIKKKDIAMVLGVRPATISAWSKSIESEGKAGLVEQRRGRKQGEKRRLSLEQEKEIQKIIIDKHPEQLKLSFVLWTREAVRQLIYQKTHQDFPIRTVGEYLKRWGFTPQKPVRLAYEQQSEKVKQWLDESYPALQVRAKAEGGEIHWGDETGVSSESYISRGYSPSGKKPVARTTGKRFSLGMISSITNEGLVRYMIYKQAMNSDIFLVFLRRLIASSDKKIFLVLDNLRSHHAKKVSVWVEKHKSRIELVFLPPYAPEYNPDEYLNQDLKSGISRKPKARDEKQLKMTVKSHMKKLQRNPMKVKNFFKHEKIRYAGHYGY
jgi:transposase